MKISIIAIVAFMLGCAAIQEKKNDDRFKQCTGICIAIEGAKCWEEPTFASGLQSASDVASCLDACQANFQFITKVDFACLSVAEGCEKLEKCVEFKAGE